MLSHLEALLPNERKKNIVFQLNAWNLIEKKEISNSFEEWKEKKTCVNKNKCHVLLIFDMISKLNVWMTVKI